MKAVDLRKLTAEELDARVEDARRSLFDMTLKKATGQIENSVGLRTARRDLARALTVRSEREASA
ncbi:MAG: 50S ribosomal protein L29 [Proteobacteria bacterium]|nr:50S ribosomal protein L29 [Pseudomonadota bacterium]